MSKDTREFIHNKGGASLWDGVELQRDKLNVNAIAYTQAADSEGTIVRFFLEQREIDYTIVHDQATGESITKDDAVALASRIRDLHLRYPFDGRVLYRALLTGQCLKLKEGQTAGEVFTAMVMLKAKDPPPAFPEWRGTTLKRIINLAVPAELNAAFGVESFSWLRYRSEDFARDYAREGCTHGSPASRLFDGGDVFFIRDRARRSRPEPDSIPVVLAPDEDTITEYIKRARSSVTPCRADYWDALVKAAAILRKHRQSGGEVLRDWAMDVLGERVRRPTGTTAADKPKNALRYHAIVEAVGALGRCGLKLQSNRDPGPAACEVVAQVFSLSPARILDIWKDRKTEISVI